jgi:uncharacterized protein
MPVILITVLTFIAAFVGSISGFGLSTIMLPVMVIFIPLPIALLFVGIIHFFSDLWKIILFKKGLRWRLLLTFGLPGILFSFIGAKIVLLTPQDILVKFLGVMLVVYVFLMFIRPKFKLPNNTLTSGVGGILSGLLAGIFGTGGVVRGAFLTAFYLPKEVYLFSSGAIGILIDSSRIITYINGGVKLPDFFLYGLIIYVPTSLLAAEVSKKFSTNIPQNKYRKVVLIFLFLIGVRLLTQ